MILASHDPESSRGLLKRRQFESWVILGTVFLVFASLFSWICSLLFQSFIPMLLGTGLAGLIAYYVFLVWNKQPMRIRCGQCGGSVECRTPWVCGHCGHENWNVNSFPFIRHCEKCHIAPKSYICHHFEEHRDAEAHIFFSEDHDTSNPARRIIGQGLENRKRADSQATVERDYEQKMQNYLREFELKKQTVESAKLDLIAAQINTQIKIAKKGASEISMETALNIHYEALKQFMEANAALDEAVRLYKLDLAEKIKGNPSLLRKRYKEIDDWKVREFAKVTKNPAQK
jgi:hypothetical protein